jgi:hypothetical protein
MSLYVVPENQELLWNVISKNAYIQDFFAPYNPEKKNEWFKTIIRTFYERYKLQKLTVADLNLVNKETISYMIQNVREQISQPVAKTTAPTQAIPSYQPANSYSIPTPPIVPDTRQDIYAKEFEQRQQEYANLNKKVVPANVNFTEKADDGVIQNMDELVKQQMQQRAYEMSLIPPPISKINQHATQPTPVNPFVQNVAPTAPPKLQIDASSNIEISIEEIASVNNKKSVTWKTDELDAEILVLRESVNNVTQEFAQLKQLFELSQTSISELKEANAGLAMKLNQLAEWSQTSIANLNETNAVLSTKLNKSVEWSHISIVHLNEANTDLSMKYNELIANQVQPQPQPHIPSPDEIKSTMERILSKMDNE